VHDVSGQSTYCAACGELLIERDWYRLGAFRVAGGRCSHCNGALAGRFDAQPGSWGARRVRMPMMSA
jgi:pyruvate formate lyase activating enzyme